MSKRKLGKVTHIAYAAISVLFILFFIYIGFFESASVQNVRNASPSYAVEQITSQEIEDASAPIGIRREYRWIMQDIGTNDTSLVFYLVHHYAEVYFDGELVYSLMPRDTNRFGKSPSSNWAVIPVYPGDSGKEVRVIVTPVYESVRDRRIEFHTAPFHSLYLAQLQSDLPQLILSGICVILGLVIILVELILIWKKKTQNWGIFFLGNFIMLLGIWKITDTRFSPFLFTGNPMLLGYLTIGALFLACIPFVLYLSDWFSESNSTRILTVSLIASGTAMVALFCQLIGIADLRQTLTLAHIVIVLVILTLLMTVFCQRAGGTPAQSKRFRVLALLLICGALADFLMFYIRRSSSGLIFTISAILVYTLTLFVNSILEINKRAATDRPTGLLNKSRWDTLMDDPTPIGDPVSMMMLDLNGLKHINDTMGHEAGDKMLRSFANILSNAIPSPNIICRWGGDEFAVMLTNADRETTEKYMEDIRSAVDAYNASGEKPALYYAAGYALSSEFPGLSRKELFGKADARMYHNKQMWYAQHTLQ